MDGGKKARKNTEKRETAVAESAHVMLLNDGDIKHKYNQSALVMNTTGIWNTVFL